MAIHLRDLGMFGSTIYGGDYIQLWAWGQVVAVAFCKDAFAESSKQEWILRSEQHGSLLAYLLKKKSDAPCSGWLVTSKESAQRIIDKMSAWCAFRQKRGKDEWDRLPVTRIGSVPMVVVNLFGEEI